MGSKSDWETMRQACEALTKLDVQFKKRIVSAHRKPQLMTKYANQAAKKSLRVIIAGAGGAAHLPGMIAAQTLVPVIGVPVKSSSLSGLDSLLSIVQMPRGVHVATVAIGEGRCIQRWFARCPNARHLQSRSVRSLGGLAEPNP